MPLPEVPAGSVLVKNAAIGVNYVDVQHRQGGYYPVSLPLIPGIEAAGIIEQVGAEVTGYAVGDRVAYAGYMGGNYAEFTAVPAENLAPVPAGVTFDVAAAGLLQCMTAHCLTNDVFHLQAGHWALVHAAAGGVGSQLVQFAKLQGATIIGVVSSAQKAAFIREIGADHAINYRERDFATAVNELTHGAGVHVVYDANGKDTFDGSLSALRRRGHMVVYGQTSGAVPAFDINRLSGLTASSTRGSSSLIWAALSHYNAEPAVFLARARTVFDLLQTQQIRVHISHRLPLQEAAEAHRLLEDRQVVGKILLIP